MTLPASVVDLKLLHLERDVTVPAIRISGARTIIGLGREGEAIEVLTF